MRIDSNTRSVVLAAFFAPVVVLAGCGSAPSERDIAVTNESGLEVVFKEHLSDTAYFEIVRERDGALQVSLIGEIGVDDEVVARGKLSESLVATYRNLRPEVVTVPEKLVELDREAQRLRADAPQRPVKAETATRPQLAAAPQEIPEEDGHEFFNTVCRDFPAELNTKTMHPRLCYWSMEAFCAVWWGEDYYYYSGNWSFFWNWSSSPTDHGIDWWGYHATVPAHNWGYHAWYRPGGTGAPVCIGQGNTNYDGYWGVTIHRL
jgi:hypothetical protein